MPDRAGSAPPNVSQCSEKIAFYHMSWKPPVKNTSPSASQEFSFDELSSLAVADQSRFEVLRLALIECAINSPGGNPAQLAALQSRLDEKVDAEIPRYLICLQLSDWLDEPYQKLTQQLASSWK